MHPMFHASPLCPFPFPPRPVPPPPPRVMPFPPPPPRPENPFPSLSVEPAATQSGLDAEIARATARENEIASGAAAAAQAAVSGIIGPVIESVTADVNRAVSSANIAAAAAQSAASGAASAVTDAVSGLAVAAAEAAVARQMSGYALCGHTHANAESGSNGFMSSGDKAKLDLYPANPSSLVDSAFYASISGLQDTYATKQELSYGVLNAKLYARDRAASAARMTASTDGNSQIQVTNSGVPTLKVKNAHLAIFTDANNSKHYFSWIPSQIVREGEPTRIDRFMEESEDPVYVIEHYYQGGVWTVKKKTGSSWIGVCDFVPIYENGIYESDFKSGSIILFETTSAISYLVTEASVGDLKSQLSRVWHPDGSLTSGQLTSSLLVSGNEGKVYNMSEAFTTTADFKEGAGKEYAAGSNVAVVPAEAGQTGYRFDVLGGSTVDLSAYRTAAAQDAIDGALDTAIAAKYTKPATGIPASDLASGVIPTVPVTSVNSKTGAVVLVANDIGDGQGGTVLGGLQHLDSTKLDANKRNLLDYTSGTTLALGTAVYRSSLNADGTFPTVDATAIQTAAAYYQFELELAVPSTVPSTITGPSGWGWLDGHGLPDPADLSGGETIFISVRLDCTARTFLASVWRVA